MNDFDANDELHGKKDAQYVAAQRRGSGRDGRIHQVGASDCQ